MAGSSSGTLEKTLLGTARMVAGFSYPASWETLQIDPNRSLWASYTPDYQPTPPLMGDTTADLAIIGGGFTGVSTAYHFSRRFPEKRVVLLEASNLANGASGRNGGMMLNWVYGMGDTSDEVTKRIYDNTNRTIDTIKQIIAEHKLDVSYRRDGAMSVFTKPESAEAGQAEAEQLQKLGIPVKYLSAAEVRARIGLNNIYGGQIDLNEGQLNGAQYIRALRPVLLNQGVAIYENTPVQKVQEGATVTLTTPHGSVRAQAIVLAMNGYTGKLGYFRKAYFPLHSHVFATAPVDDATAAAMGWQATAGFADDLNRLAYSTRTREGHLVFGGGTNSSYGYLFGNKTAFPGTPSTAQQGFADMQAVLNSYLPETAKLAISHRWTGTLAISFRRNCSMGVRGDHRNVYYALGYSGHGVTAANMAGEVLTDLYSDNEDRWRGLPFIEAGFDPIPLEPFRWLGYQMFTRLIGRSPRTG